MPALNDLALGLHGYDAACPRSAPGGKTPLVRLAGDNVLDNDS